ncbi:DUF1566 domain-containing protein [Aliiglaciecola sp. CAU 1673]|uniref:Lcl C-terminal domain-containing protein n=1 Tax=Aliiglaciecola sp. CAU 1673 TaxID=3032595 RepID=UPI0023D9B167|nr:DUF1566 domain-containing protein [Aliiglaciecola sp. CAU 1673]MDF2177443.1 DUF1566 domain-containing protein [Aliiglaciecola sp. CAU 1673]
MRVLFLIVASCLLQACSSDDFIDGKGDDNLLVVVTAGADQSVDEQTLVTLSAQARGQTDTLTYRWSVSPNISFTQASTSEATATFTTPTTSVPLSYVFTLVVTDGQGNSGTDDTIITVNPVNAQPTAFLNVTEGTPMTDGRYPAGIRVTLDGTDSIDADPPTGKAPIASWRWQQTQGTSVVEGLSLDGDSLSINTPIEQDGQTLSFTLTVTDQEGAQDSESIEIQVLSVGDTPPAVTAGIEQSLFSGESILLAGTASTVNSAALPLTYRWLNDSALAPAIQSPTSLITSAAAPVIGSTDTATFTLEVKDALGHISEASVRAIIRPMPQARLNDTGVTRRADNSSLSDNALAAFPGQDGDRGRDRAAAHGLLTKAGRGEGGFDFTRLDANGDEQDDTSQPWRCVRDNLTGLIWEVKDDSGGVHDIDHRFSWYQSTNTGGNPGVLNGAGTSCTQAQCNTSAHVTAVNAAGLCGFYDWRLPTHRELLSLVHYGKSTIPLIDTQYFPDVTNNGPFWFWTSGSSVDGTSTTAQNAWAINFSSGNDNFLNKSSAAAVRLVRAGR